MTGKCVTADRKSSTKMCEIYSWCPVEYDELPMPGTNFGVDLKKFVYEYILHDFPAIHPGI